VPALSTLILPVALALVLAIAAGPARAALPVPPVSLDPAFGNGGTVKTDLRLAWPVVRQSGGRPVVAGSGTVVRFGRGGFRDAGFGIDGLAETATLADGARLTSGLVISPRGQAFTVATTTSGAGRSAGYGMEVIKLEPTGVLDRSFGQGGLVGVEPGVGPLYPARSTATGTSLALDSNGRLLLAGGARVERPREAIAGLTLLKRDGSVARSFGVGGSFRLRADGPGSAEFTDVKVLADGGILVAGVFGDRVAVARLDREGRPDPGFGRGGITVISTTAGTGPPFVAGAGPGAKVVVGGGGRIFVLHGAFGVNRVTALRKDGRRLKAFGNNGTTGFWPGAWGLDWKAILPVSGGGVLLAGSSYRAEGGPFTRRSALLLLGSDGKRQKDFGKDGLWRNVSPETGGFSDVTVLPGGALLAAGTANYTGDRGELLLTRLLTRPVSP
jgi:uncharacterized delta-60 repeat protein